MLLGQISAYISILPIFLMSLAVHEYAHGWVAYRFGDDTAKRMGRLTLNPLAHISFFGTIILPLVAHFGWARPVPVNFSILTRRQIFLVSIAGPGSNVLLAGVLAGAFHLLGYKVLGVAGDFVLLAILFNLILAVFNLIPVPPLDGSKMVYASLRSAKAVRIYNSVARFGLLVLIGLLFFGGFDWVVWPVVGWLYSLLGLPVPAV